MKTQPLRVNPASGGILQGREVDCLPVVLMALNGQGVISDVNQAWERIMGYAIGDTCSRPLSRFMPADFRCSITGADFPRGNALVRFEFPLLTKDQRVLWFAYYAHRRGADAISGYLLDTTGAQQVRALSRLLENAGNRLQESVASIDEIIDGFMRTGLDADQRRLLDLLRDKRAELERMRSALTPLLLSPGAQD